MEKKKRGRPLKNKDTGYRNKKFCCNLNESEYELLVYLSEKTRLSKNEIVVTGLNIYKKLVVDKH